jgi:hypothetical protein
MLVVVSEGKVGPLSCKRHMDINERRKPNNTFPPLCHVAAPWCTFAGIRIELLVLSPAAQYGLIHTYESQYQHVQPLVALN